MCTTGACSGADLTSAGVDGEGLLVASSVCRCSDIAACNSILHAVFWVVAAVSWLAFVHQFSGRRFASCAYQVCCCAGSCAVNALLAMLARYHFALVEPVMGVGSVCYT
jgi:hypothetical protein